MSLCKVCDEPLVLLLDPEDTDVATSGSAIDPATVPDDLELRCGCHFHWQCLLDQSSDVVASLKCPSCSRSLCIDQVGSSSSDTPLGIPVDASILATYINEGGIQNDLNILPPIAEEAYLEMHPEARPARALHVMCMEGDVFGMIEMLRDLSEEIEDLGPLIRYQDPLAEMKSGLHLAIENSQEEAVWLLLWLSSTVPVTAFPDSARQAVESMGISRLQVTTQFDIRNLLDVEGRTAYIYAQQQHEAWASILEAGVLSA